MYQHINSTTAPKGKSETVYVHPGDLIRRTDVLELLNSRVKSSKGIFGDLGGAVSGVRELIKAMPSAEPERKTGRWVLWNEPGCEYAKCTACGEMYDQDDLYIGGNDYPKFCPNCGADMRGE